VTTRIAAWAAWGCRTACPSGVDYGKNSSGYAGRADRTKTETVAGRKAPPAIYVRNFYAADRLRRIALTAACLSKSGIAGRRARIGFAEVVAEERCRPKEALFPGLGGGPREAVAEVHRGRRHEAPPLSRLLLGCVQRDFFRKSMPRTARVLAVKAAKSSRGGAPCSEPSVHAGEGRGGRWKLAKRTIDACERAKTSRRSHQCRPGAAFKRERVRPHAARRSAYAERARVSRPKCKDISESMAARAAATRHRLKNARGLPRCGHCSRRRAFVTTARITSSIPGMELAEIPKPPICCGPRESSPVQPMPPMSLGIARRTNFSVNADVVAKGHPGCVCKCNPRWHAMGRRFRGAYVQLVDASIAGAESRSLRRLIHSRKPLLEGDAGLLAMSRKLSKTGQHQRTQVFRRHFLLAFRVAGQEWPLWCREAVW